MQKRARNVLWAARSCYGLRASAASGGQFGLGCFRRLSAVVQFLAPQTVRCPRHRREAFGRDRLLAFEARPKLAILDAFECRIDLPETIILEFQSPDCEGPFNGECTVSISSLDWATQMASRWCDFCTITPRTAISTVLCRFTSVPFISAISHSSSRNHTVRDTATRFDRFRLFVRVADAARCRLLSLPSGSCGVDKARRLPNGSWRQRWFIAVVLNV